MAFLHNHRLSMLLVLWSSVALGNAFVPPPNNAAAAAAVTQQLNVATDKELVPPVTSNDEDILEMYNTNVQTTYG